MRGRGGEEGGYGLDGNRDVGRERMPGTVTLHPSLSATISTDLDCQGPQCTQPPARIGEL